MISDQWAVIREGGLATGDRRHVDFCGLLDAIGFEEGTGETDDGFAAPSHDEAARGTIAAKKHLRQCPSLLLAAVGDLQDGRNVLLCPGDGVRIGGDENDNRAGIGSVCLLDKFFLNRIEGGHNGRPVVDALLDIAAIDEE